MIDKIAFFDVDETVISIKSMFSFLDYILSRQGWDSRDRDKALHRFRRLAEEGMAREEINRKFYQSFAGMSVKWIDAIGKEWFEKVSKESNFYHNNVVWDLRNLAENGYWIVLVSGSFRPCLDPIARQLDVDQVICTELCIENGTYTGDVVVPMIGVEKSVAFKEVMRSFNVSKKDCIAYGDHLSDLPMLKMAADAVVVNGSSEMRKIAKKKGWRMVSN